MRPVSLPVSNFDPFSSVAISPLCLSLSAAQIDGLARLIVEKLYPRELLAIRERFLCGFALGISTGRVFVKGVEGVSRRMRFLRNEITAGTLAEGLAPAVLFSADIGEWLVVVFEYLPGRAADLSPGSADLPVVARTLNRIGDRTAPGLRPLRDRWSGTDWWARLADEHPEAVHGWDAAEMNRWAIRLPDLAAGDRLTHTDLHGDQFRIGQDGAVHVIDWAFPGAGAPWVDPAFIVLRLIEAGHDPADAEAWARANLTGLHDVEDAHLSAFAAYLAGMWTHWTLTRSGRGLQHRARLARYYSAWRLGLRASA